MKTIATLLVLISATSFAAPAGKQSVCNSLYDKAIHNCEISMCEEWLKDELKTINQKNINECLSNGDGDLMEGAQICATDGGEFEDLIKAYNRKNPKNKVNCDDN